MKKIYLLFSLLFLFNSCNRTYKLENLSYKKIYIYDNCYSRLYIKNDSLFLLCISSPDNKTVYYNTVFWINSLNELKKMAYRPNISSDTFKWESDFKELTYGELHVTYHNFSSGLRGQKRLAILNVNDNRSKEFKIKVPDHITDMIIYKDNLWLTYFDYEKTNFYAVAVIPLEQLSSLTK